MIPVAWVLMRSLPLTANGKLDKHALPEPDWNASAADELPMTDTEIALCNIWKEVLGVERISITSDFFEIGGDSLLAITAIARIRKLLAVDVRVKEFFLNTTIRLLSRVIQATTEDQYRLPYSHQDNGDDGDVLDEALYSQTWRYMEYKGGIYSPMPGLIQKELSGVNTTALSDALNTLVARHESLRTLFWDADGKVFQKVLAEHECGPRFEMADISQQENKIAGIEAVMAEMTNYLFDFQKEQSFRCKLVQYEKDKYLFLFVIDHIINDAQSTRIIEEELFAIYEAYTKMLPNPLAGLKLQFRDYSLFHNRHYKGDKLAGHQQYFKKLFADVPPRLAVRSAGSYKDMRDGWSQVNYADVPKNSKGNGYVFVISKDILDKMYVLIAELKISVFNFILAGYCVFLNRISGQRDFCINSPMSTRNNEEYLKIIGWLTGELFLRVRVDDEVSFKELLYVCRDTIVEAVEHIYYQDVVNLLGVEWGHLVSAQLNLMEQTHAAGLMMCKSRPAHYVAGHVSTGINFNVHLYNDCMLVNCTYKTDFADRSEIEGICDQFVEVMRLSVNMPDMYVGRLEEIES